MSEYTPEKIARALRCASTPNGDCIGEECPFFVEEEVPEDMAREIGRVKWPSCDVDAIGMAAADVIEKLDAQVELIGEFGKLFEAYKGCPRGAMGRACIPIEEEVFSMKPITDVDGGRWVPVNADALSELVDKYLKLKWSEARMFLTKRLSLPLEVKRDELDGQEPQERT